MSTNLKDREKEKVSDRLAKLNEKKSDRKLEHKIKGDRFSLEEQHENFVAAERQWELLAAIKVKMSGSEKKVNKNTYDISSIKRVTRKFLEASRCSRANQRPRNVQKSVVHVQSCFFAN